LWNLLPSTRSRIDWTTTSPEMDAYKAQLFKSIIYKYKYKYKDDRTDDIMMQIADHTV